MKDKTVYTVIREIGNLEQLQEARVIRGSLLTHLSIYEHYRERLEINITLKYSDPAMRARTESADRFSVSEETVSKVIYYFNSRVANL